LYDRGLKPSVSFNIPVVCVGNLTVGGTGKTPMIEYLIRLLSPAYKIATLSRGYGRATKGFFIASSKDNALTLGDEPYQFFRKFHDRVTVAVGEERALAIPLILQGTEDVEVVLLDDAYQHRRVRPSFNILLTDYNRPFYMDLLLPAGRLRESKMGASRADLVVVTKCPRDTSDDTMMEIEKDIRQIAAKPIFFTAIGYSNPLPFPLTQGACKPEVILLTGIADAQPLVNYVKKNFTLKKHIEYPDHHRYTASELEDLAAQAAELGNVSIVTTEKDMVKIDTREFERHLKHLSLFYIPITVQFLKNETDFDEIILNHVKNVVDKNNRESNQ
jgi:tetraacyldisaccharide 4'-kinase